MHRRETFTDGLARLETQQENSNKAKAEPDTLPKNKIRTVPSVFQPRVFYDGRDVDEQHVKSLVRSLVGSNNTIALESILVMRIGKEAVCVDGHHRLAAYKSAGWPLGVPVTWFSGGIRDAVKEAVRRNSRDKLAMTRPAKREAAWRLTVLGGHSKAEISQLTTVSLGTVGNMRRRLKELEAEHDAAPAAIDEFTGKAFKEPYQCRLTWDQAKNHKASEIERDPDWEDGIVSEWVERLAKAFGKRWGQHPKLAARAIAMFSESLPPKLLEAWLEDGIIDAEDLTDHC